MLTISPPSTPLLTINYVELVRTTTTHNPIMARVDKENQQMYTHGYEQWILHKWHKYKIIQIHAT